MINKLILHKHINSNMGKINLRKVQIDTNNDEEWIRCSAQKTALNETNC